jgi:hypothetical protein
MGTNRVRVSLGDINRNGLFQIRDINSTIVAQFKDAMRMGAEFPPITVDQNNNLIDGFTRHEAMRGLYEPNEVITVIKHTFKDDKERLEYAGKQNQQNGYRLTPFEEKRLAFRLARLGADQEQISSAIGRPVKKIISWHKDALIVTGPKGGEREEPRKRGVDKGIKKVTEKQYGRISREVSGWTPNFHADQIILHIENKTLNFENADTVDKLRELIEVIEKALKERSAA